MRVADKPNPSLPLFDPVNPLEVAARRVQLQRERFLERERAYEERRKAKNAGKLKGIREALRTFAELR